MFYRQKKTMLRTQCEAPAAGPRRLARALVCAAIGVCSAALVCACSASSHEARSVPGNAETSNIDAGNAVLQSRLADPGDPGRPLGPGDVLKINVAGADEFNDCTVRVSGEGTINAPLAGIIQAAGLSEDALAHELSDRLRKYVRNPQVQVFVQEYRSNQVGVFGAVTRPGVYNIAGSGDSLQDMISQAGGFTPTAARRIELIPARPNTAALIPAGKAAHDGASGVDRITIDLSDPLGGRYLSAPAHIGDVIFVPELGQVLVEGWVEKPGSYSISPGLGTLGAIAAAGGALYPADLHSVGLVRVKPDGRTELKTVDVAAIEAGETRDVQVRDSDVVQVGYTTAKAIPYGVYQVFTDVFHVGAYVAPALP